MLKFRFVAFHIAFLVAVIWVPWTTESLWLGFALYWIRMFGVTAGYHRYFAHRSYKTSRTFAFILAWIAQSSAQRGVIWWASNHRHHHRYSDLPEDLHSPVTSSLFHAHVGWLWDSKSYEYRKNATDLERCPELVWLNQYPMIPAFVLAIVCYLWMDWSGVVYGFGISTIVLFHGTFTINSLTHVWGKRRFNTKDDSRNNVWLAIITMGEGWHNNHHRYMRSVRQGFYWWEFDPTYYVLSVLSWVGIVWDFRSIPSEVLSEGMETNSLTVS